MHAQRDDRPFRLSAPVFACPACGRTSHCPEDARQGYCGACHDFTGRGDVYECGDCGTRFIVPPSHAGAVWCSCGAPEPMHPAREPRVVIDAAAPYVHAADVAAFAELAENPSAPWECRAPGIRVDEEWARQNFPGLISSDPPPESAGSQDEADVYPYDSSMRWSPGDTEW